MMTHVPAISGQDLEGSQTPFWTALQQPSGVDGSHWQQPIDKHSVSSKPCPWHTCSPVSICAAVVFAPFSYTLKLGWGELGSGLEYCTHVICPPRHTRQRAATYEICKSRIGVWLRPSGTD